MSNTSLLQIHDRENIRIIINQNITYNKDQFIQQKVPIDINIDNNIILNNIDFKDDDVDLLPFSDGILSPLQAQLDLNEIGEDDSFYGCLKAQRHMSIVLKPQHLYRLLSTYTIEDHNSIFSSSLKIKSDPVIEQKLTAIKTKSPFLLQQYIQYKILNIINLTHTTNESVITQLEINLNELLYNISDLNYIKYHYFKKDDNVDMSVFELFNTYETIKKHLLSSIISSYDVAISHKHIETIEITYDFDSIGSVDETYNFKKIAFDDIDILLQQALLIACCNMLSKLNNIIKHMINYDLELLTPTHYTPKSTSVSEDNHDRAGSKDSSNDKNIWLLNFQNLF